MIGGATRVGAKMDLTTDSGENSVVLLIHSMVIWMVLGVEGRRKGIEEEGSQRRCLFLDLVSWYKALAIFFKGNLKQ